MSPFRGSAPFTDEWKHFDVQRVDGIATITLNRPDKLNALTFGAYADLRDFLAEVPHRDDTKVIVLRGEGGCFSTGQDMSVAYSWYGPDASRAGDKPARPTQTRRLAYDKWAQQPYHRLYETNKVVIGQIEGYALGGGLEFALSCDLTVCGHGTKIGMPAARRRATSVAS